MLKSPPTKAITTRKVNLALVLHAVESSPARLSVPEIAVKTNLTGTTVSFLLNELETERKITRYGSSRTKESSRFGPFVMPEVRVYEFRPLRPQKQTVVPVREQGRLAPDIYKDVIFIGASA